MKILITGATGLIGSEISKQLYEQGIPMHYLTTSSSKIKNSALVSGFLWNPRKGAIDLAAFEGVTHIINLAGVTIASRWTKAYKNEILQSRIQSIETLKKAILELKGHSISYFLGASAIGVYPSDFEKTYSLETNVPNENDSFLRKTVLAWEKANNSITALGISVGQLRVGLVMDLQKGALAAFIKPIRFGVGAAFGSGKQWQSWVHIEDIARLFIFLSTARLEGTYNGVSPNPVTQNQLLSAIAIQLKRPLWLPSIPFFLMKGLLGEMADLLFESQRVKDLNLEKAGFTFKYKNVETALSQLIEGN